MTTWGDIQTLQKIFAIKGDTLVSDTSILCGHIGTVNFNIRKE